MEHRHKTVLIIEDDHDIRVALRTALEEDGYFVVSATNGAAALTLLESMTAPACILLDLNMPIMNGDQFLAVIAQDRKLAQIPIIQMSAATDKQRPGTRLAFKKPVDLCTLLDAINNCTLLT